MNENNNFEEDDDIIVLKNSDGEELEFTEIAGIAYKGKFYAILQPNFDLEDMYDEAMVFEVTVSADGSNHFNIVLDDDIIDAVFEQYNILFDDAIKNKNDN